LKVPEFTLYQMCMVQMLLISYDLWDLMCHKRIHTGMSAWLAVWWWFPFCCVVIPILCWFNVLLHYILTCTLEQVSLSSKVFQKHLFWLHNVSRLFFRFLLGFTCTCILLQCFGKVQANYDCLMSFWYFLEAYNPLRVYSHNGTVVH
jgi:hypothetical protein